MFLSGFYCIRKLVGTSGCCIISEMTPLTELTTPTPITTDSSTSSSTTPKT